jgi:hypothetical protein
MDRHLRQADHNQNFHDCITENFSTNFFDWKITVIFYKALHCVKAIADKKGLYIGDTHVTIMKSIQPGLKSTVMPLSYSAWDAYKRLYHYCHAARYNGCTTDFDVWQKLKESDYKSAVVLLKTLEDYFESEGIKFKKYSS